MFLQRPSHLFAWIIWCRRKAAGSPSSISHKTRIYWHILVTFYYWLAIIDFLNSTESAHLLCTVTGQPVSSIRLFCHQQTPTQLHTVSCHFESLVDFMRNFKQIFCLFGEICDAVSSCSVTCTEERFTGVGGNPNPSPTPQFAESHLSVGS